MHDGTRLKNSITREIHISMKMNRVFLKLSGEALAGPKHTGFDEDTVKEVARQVKLSVDAGRTGGHRHRRRQFLARAHQRGHRPHQGGPDRHAATVMNCIYVSEIFRNAGMKPRF